MSEYSWNILPDAPPAPPTGDAPAGSDTAPGATTRTTRRALLRPFQRDQKHSFAVGTGMPLHRSRVGQILGTEVGELDYDPTLGSRLDELRFRDLDETTEELGRYFVTSALEEQYRAVRVTDVRIERVKVGDVTQPNALDFHVLFVPVDARGAPTGVEDSVRVRRG